MAGPEELEAVIACNHFAIFQVLLHCRVGICVMWKREMADSNRRGNSSACKLFYTSSYMENEWLKFRVSERHVSGVFLKEEVGKEFVFHSTLHVFCLSVIDFFKRKKETA